MEPEGIILAVFRAIYRRRKASDLEITKPRFKWLPKYEVTVRLPADIITGNLPDEQLEILLSNFGFEIE